MSRHRNFKVERYVKLKYWFLRSPAWRSLPAMARALYVEVATRYNGANNGSIPYSVRDGVRALHASPATIVRTLRLLDDRGFIARTKRGAFSLKTSHDASEWRLTEHNQDAPHPNHATKDFMHWQPPEPDATERPNFKTRFHHRSHMASLVKPRGFSGETVNAENGPSGFSGETKNAQNRPRVVSPEKHSIDTRYQGGPPPGGDDGPKTPWTAPSLIELSS